MIEVNKNINGDTNFGTEGVCFIYFYKYSNRMNGQA